MEYMDDIHRTGLMRDRAKELKKVYICSPLRGDIKGNIQRAREYCHAAVLQGVMPVCPHLFFTQFLDDSVESERQQGMQMGLAMLDSCQELWQYGPPTEGMAMEIHRANLLGIPVLRKE